MLTNYENVLKQHREMRERKGWSVSMERAIGDPF
jgi:hypothetical protein